MNAALRGMVAFVAILILTSCDPEPPVFETGSYLPAYPGSYWKYEDQDGNISQDLILEYVRDSTPDGNEYRVPIYRGLKLWKYDFHLNQYGYSGSGWYYPPFRKFIKDDVPVNSSWQNGYTSIGVNYRYKISARDTAVTINSTVYFPTIIIQYWNSTFIPNELISVYYYTKDIGLIRSEHYDSDTITSYENLIEYYINH